MHKPSLCIKEQSTKRKFENFLFCISFYFPKMGKTVFDLYKVKINIFLNISSFLALKQIKECVLKFFWLILGLKSKLSEALRPRKEATLRHAILDLWSNNNLAQHRICSFFPSKSLHPTVHKQEHNAKIQLQSFFCCCCWYFHSI